MDKSTEENLNRLKAEASQLLKDSNYTESANKYWEAARSIENARGLDSALELYDEAIQNFIRASEVYKDKKQFRTSAQNLHQIMKIYSHLSKKDDWAAATEAAVEDLLSAANDYLLWNEYDRAITLVTAGCFLLLGIDHFSDAENHYTQYINTIKDPAFTSAQQILYSVGYAIKAVKDIDAQALINAQQLVSSHVKPSLRQLMGDFFLSDIDNALDFVSTKFRSQIKLPKISPEFIVSKDLVLNELHELTISIINEGEGEAHKISLKISIPEDIEILQGKTDVTIESLLPNDKFENKISFRAQSSTGTVTYQVNATLSFVDLLQARQTMMVGPYDLTFREISLTKEYTEKLEHLQGQLKDHTKRLDTIGFIPQEITTEISTFITQIADSSKKHIEEQEFLAVTANFETIQSFNTMADKVVSEEFARPLLSRIEEEEKQKMMKIEQETKEKLESAFNEEKSRLATVHKKEIEQLNEEFNKKVAYFEQQLKNKDDEVIQLQKSFNEEKEEIKNLFENEKERLRQTLKDEKTNELKELSDSLNLQIEKMKETHEVELKTQKEKKEKEMQELIVELDKKQKAEIEQIEQNHQKGLSQALNEQSSKFERVKKEALEKQEDLLREEFRNQLSSAQSSK